MCKIKTNKQFQQKVTCGAKKHSTSPLAGTVNLIVHLWGILDTIYSEIIKTLAYKRSRFPQISTHDYLKFVYSILTHYAIFIVGTTGIHW